MLKVVRPNTNPSAICPRCKEKFMFVAVVTDEVDPPKYLTYWCHCDIPPQAKRS
jgi:hypothetical protein